MSNIKKASRRSPYNFHHLDAVIPPGIGLRRILPTVSCRSASLQLKTPSEKSLCVCVEIRNSEYAEV